MYSEQRTDGAGSSFMDAGEHQGWDGVSEEIDRTFWGDPDDPALEDWYDEQLAVLYDHHDRMVYNMMGWLAVGCHHLSEEAWQAHDLERAQLEGMRIHETQPPHSQLYSQEDPKQCGEPLLFVCTCVLSSTPAGLTSLTSLREHCRLTSSIFAV